jgi:sialidase-1
VAARNIIITLLVASACSASDPQPNADADSGTATQTDTGTDTGTLPDLIPDMSPDLSEFDAVFTLSDGPFQIRGALPGEHVAFPDVARLADGRLLLVYREAIMHSVDPTGRLIKQFGQPDGVSWSDPEILFDEPDIDDRDPSITTLADGTVAINYFRYVFQPTIDGPLSVYQVFHGQSHDDGATFEGMSIIAGAMDYPSASVGLDGLWQDSLGIPITVRACSSPIIEVDGRLHAQIYGGPPWVPTNLDAPRSRVILATTDDYGGSWSEAAIAPEQGTDLWLQEPAILALDPQRWIMHVRVAEGDSPGNVGVLRQAFSDDGGQSWSEYEPFEFIGQAPYLARLQSGVLISAFRWIDDAMSTSAVNFMYSMDEGETWSDLISIVPPQFSEVGYPSIVELDDGRVLFIYYVNGNSIRGTIYDVELVDAG